MNWACRSLVGLTLVVLTLNTNAANAGGKVKVSLKRAPGALSLRVHERVKSTERCLRSNGLPFRRCRSWVADYLELPPVNGGLLRQRRYRLARELDYGEDIQHFNLDGEILEPTGLEDKLIEVSAAPQNSSGFVVLSANQKRARAVDAVIEGMLPAGPQKPGARWRTQTTQILDFFSDGGGRFRGRGSVVFIKMVEEEGRQRAHLRLEIKGRRRSQKANESTITKVKIRGDMFWDLAGFPARLKVEGTFESLVRGQYVNIDSKGRVYVGDRYSKRRFYDTKLVVEARVAQPGANEGGGDGAEVEAIPPKVPELKPRGGRKIPPQRGKSSDPKRIRKVQIHRGLR